MSQQGREVVIVEAVRTPIGRGHPEKGYYKDTHPNDLLGRCYTEVLDTGADDDVVHAGGDPRGAEVHGLLRRAALAIDCHAGDVIGQARDQPASARDVSSLAANRVDAAEYNVIDGRGIDTSSS